MKQSTKGFTLIELIAVMVIVGILALQAIPRLPSSSHVEAATFVNVLLSDLRLTKVLAMSESAPYQLVISAGGYQIQDESGNPYTHPETGTSQISFPSGFSISPSSQTIQFNALGQPLVSGSVTSNDTTLSIDADGISQEITITGQTGYIAYD